MPSTNIESSRVFEVRGLKWSGDHCGTTGGPLGVIEGAVGAFSWDVTALVIGSSYCPPCFFDMASSSMEELILILHGI